MRVGSWNLWHDGRIDDTQSLHTEHTAVWIHHGAGVVGCAHPASATGMPEFTALGQQALLQLRIRGDVVRSQATHPDVHGLRNRPESGMASQGKEPAYPVTQPEQIACVREQAEVDRWVHL